MSRREIERAVGHLEDIVRGYLKAHPAFPKGSMAEIRISLPRENMDEATRKEFPRLPRPIAPEVEAMVAQQQRERQQMYGPFEANSPEQMRQYAEALARQSGFVREQREEVLNPQPRPRLLCPRCEANRRRANMRYAKQPGQGGRGMERVTVA